MVHSGRGEPAEIGKLRVPLPQRFERVVVRDEEPAQAEVPQSRAVVPFLPSPLGHREQQRDKLPGERLRLARKGGGDKRRVALTVDGEERGAPDLRQRYEIVSGGAVGPVGSVSSGGGTCGGIGSGCGGGSGSGGGFGSSCRCGAIGRT